MSVDLETLLAPIEGEDPAGPDLAYDAARIELEQAFETSISIDPSGEVTETAEVNWPRVVNDVVDQFERTKDIWLAVYLARAGARAGDLSAVVGGVQALEGLVDRYWESMHPKLEELGVQGRTTPCESLNSPGQFLIPLERAALISHPRLGQFSGHDLERFRQGGDAEDGFGFFQAALNELGEAALADAGAKLTAIEAGLKRADALFVEKAGIDAAPNFQPAYQGLAKLHRAVRAFMTEADGAASSEAADEASEAGAPAAAGRGGAPGRVESREDVVRAIDAICDYYRRREPSSPVPLVLARARTWVTTDFMTLLNDIAPGSLDEAGRVLLKREATEESTSDEY